MNDWERCSNNHASEAQHLVDCAERVSDIPQEAVEAVAKATAPHRWDPEWLPIIFHGETLETARSRARVSAMTTARRALEAAAPYLQAAAWEEGRRSLQEDLSGTPRIGMPGYKETPNPYKDRA